MNRLRFGISLSRLAHVLAVLTTTLVVSAVLFYGVGRVGLQLEDSGRTVRWLSFTLIGLLVMGAGWAIWKRLPWLSVFFTFGLSAGFVYYLISDVGPRPPAPLINALAATDSKSYQTYRWLLKGDPQSRLVAPPQGGSDIPPFPIEKEKWSEFLRENRAVFEKAWANDSLGRAWIEAMAETAPDGLFPPAGVESPILSFRVIRQTCIIRWAMAQLTLLDGHGDEAARLLLPLLRASYHLQQGGSTLVTQMIATVCLRGTYARLEIFLESGSLSMAARGEISAVLRESPPIQQSIGNAFLGERFFSRSSIDLVEKNPSEAMKTVVTGKDLTVVSNRFLWRLFFNPHQAAEEYVSFLDEVSLLAQQRRLEEGNESTRRFKENVTRWRLKNPVGHLLISMVMPAFQKVSSKFWEVEDQRIALADRLRG